jgi:uncharacterized membrane protein
MHPMHKADTKIMFIYVLTLLGAALWLTMIFLAPFLKSHWAFGADLIYAVCSPLCHQNPSRCFVISGYPMAVCTRCLGIYSGFFLGTCIYPFIRGLRFQSLPRKGVLIAVSLPIVIDTAGNVLTLWMTTAWIRFMTGVFWGSFLPFFLMPGLMDMVLNKMSSAQSDAFSLD